MSKNKLVLDPRSLNIKKAGVQTWKLVKNLLLGLVVSLTLAILAYVVVAVVFSTEEEKTLYRENKMYEKTFSTLEAKQDLLEDVIGGLQHKDNEIYEQVFHSNAPNVDPMSTLDFLYASDTIPDTRLTSYTRDKARKLLDEARSVDAAFMDIFTRLADTAFTLPPMSLPVKGISYPQTGASTGRKMSPFLKAYVYHDGLDLIVLRGTDVYAPADGEVTKAGNAKTPGRYVEITHAGGYVTEYHHLESVDVKVGQKVRLGQKIGSVGLSGSTYAPHLHYEVRRDGLLVDPVNYLFASIGPSDYANMLYMATNTLQSMD